MDDFDLDDFDQIVKGRVGIKKLSKYRYRITFSKIGKFLIYQVWNKNNPNNINDNRYIYNMPAKDWVNKFKAVNEDLQKNNKPLFTQIETVEQDVSVFNKLGGEDLFVLIIKLLIIANVCLHYL